MTTKEDIQEQLESFGKEMTEEVEEILEEVEDLHAFSEWLEKMDGNVHAARNYYPLLVDMKVDSETLEEKVHPWNNWYTLEPHDPPRWDCPVCGNEFIEVETYGPVPRTHGAVNQFTGHMTYIERCSDPAGEFYDELNRGGKICGDCANDFRQAQPGGESTLRIFFPDDKLDSVIHFKNGVRYDTGSPGVSRAEYSNLPKYLREAVRDVVKQETVRNMEKTSAMTQGFDRSFTRRGFNQWVHNLVVHPPDEYHFDFPLMAVGTIRNTAEISGGYLFTPRLERYDGAKEEVESWVTEERINEFRRDRMR